MPRKLLLTIVLLLSGLSGISYEILYGRMLGAMLGDQFAVSATILITFLLGIGLGAKFAHRLWKWLWAIEAMIGIYGIGFAMSRGVIEQFLYDGMGFLPGLTGPIMLGMLLLLIPSLMLGCSVPLFAGYLGRMKNKGSVFAGVYSLYNMGAAATALLIEFWLIRQFGVSGSVFTFGFVNLLAASLLFFVGKPISLAPPDVAPEIRLPRNYLVSLVLVSVASAIFQLFMVKISELMFGPFRESFAFVLAIILFGIAVGSYLVKRLHIRYTSLLLTNLIGLFLFLMVYQDLLYVYAALYEKSVEHGHAILFLKGGVLFVLMGLPAITFGATIPALISAKCDVAKESGSLLYISSLANVVGFLLMALVLHQYLDYGVQLLAISGLVTVALIIYKWDSIYKWRNTRLPTAATAVLMASIGLHHARWDEDLLYLSYTSFQSAKDMAADRKAFNFPEKFKGYQDVFSINWSNGKPYFFINGYISIPMNNPSERVVGTIGPMFTPKTHEALVLGLGSGATAGAVGQLFDHTDVVEINPVVRDNQFRMKRWNFDIEQNKNVHIFVDDAIHYIQSSQKSYDMILNTVTSPLYFSSSKLYTLDFFDKIKKRLNSDGVYLTWMDTRIGSQGAHIVLNTIRQRFKHCSVVFIKSGYYLLLASDNPVRLQNPDLTDKAPALNASLLKDKIIPRQLAYNILTSEMFADNRAFNAPVNTIDHPVLEFEMASLTKKEFKQFQKQLFAMISLDDVARGIEPRIKYDPIEHIAHVRLMLNNSAITARFEQLGRIYVRDMDIRVDAATLEMYQSIAKDANDADIYHALGDQYRIRDRFDEAIAEYRHALAIDPKHKDTLFNIAACEEYLGQIDDALYTYGEAGKQNPSDLDVPFRKARVSLKLGNLPDALAFIGRADQKSESVLELKASILQQMLRPVDANAVYLELLKLNPDNADAQYELNKSMAKW